MQHQVSANGRSVLNSGITEDYVCFPFLDILCMKNGWCLFGVNNVDICSMRTLQRFCSCKGSRNSWVGDRSPKEYLLN